MRHVVGYGAEVPDPHMHPLQERGRLRFDTRDWRTRGYFAMLAPLFDHFALRDSGMEIFSIHVAFTLGRHDLEECDSILRNFQDELAEYPASWRPDLGEQHTGMGADRVITPIRPLLFRTRALAIVERLLRLVQDAATSGKTVLYGNGACYGRFCNIRGAYYS